MWPSVTTAPPALRALLEPGDGAQHPAAGWFAWALSQSWQPPLFRNDALTSPTPFGVATRQWLFEKRNEAATPAAGKVLGALWHRHLLVVTLLGAIATGRWIRSERRKSIRDGRWHPIGSDAEVARIACAAL